MPRQSKFDSSFLSELEKVGAIAPKDGKVLLYCVDTEGNAVAVPLSRFASIPASVIAGIEKKHSPEVPAIVLRAMTAGKRLLADGLITAEQAAKMVEDAKVKAAQEAANPGGDPTLPGTEPAK